MGRMCHTRVSAPRPSSWWVDVQFRNVMIGKKNGKKQKHSHAQLQQFGKGGSIASSFCGCILPLHNSWMNSEILKFLQNLLLPVVRVTFLWRKQHGSQGQDCFLVLCQTISPTISLVGKSPLELKRLVSLALQRHLVRQTQMWQSVCPALMDAYTWNGAIHPPKKSLALLAFQKYRRGSQNPLTMVNESFQDRNGSQWMTNRWMILRDPRCIVPCRGTTEAGCP